MYATNHSFLRTKAFLEQNGAQSMSVLALQITSLTHTFMLCIVAKRDHRYPWFLAKSTSKRCTIRENQKDGQSRQIQNPLFQGTCLSSLYSTISNQLSSQYLYTLCVTDTEKADKLTQSLPPGQTYHNHHSLFVYQLLLASRITTQGYLDIVWVYFAAKTGL